MATPSNPTVADVMTSDLIAVGPDAPLGEAIRLLAENRISGLPVIDTDNNLVGVISETDLMWQETGVRPPAYIMLLDSVIYLENPATYDRELHKALGQTVREVMTKDVITVAPDKPLRDAAQLMHKRKIHRVIVVDADKTVIGVLTRGDIVRFMASQQT
ncbi:MAG: CBS domain-containing protein [Elainellaceae cyanobacterium]